MRDFSLTIFLCNECVVVGTTGMWNACSNVLDEWGIDEIEESLESLTPKNEVVEQVRVTSATEIQYLAVVDSEAIHFSLILPAQIAI